MIDLTALRAACGRHGAVARVVVAALDGSSPREAGASMTVWGDGQEGTIGGGALEWEAAARARDMLAGAATEARLDRIALGPTLGQCCGGSVLLWTEVFRADALPAPVAGLVARGKGEMPLAVRRLLARARGAGLVPATQVVAGWLVEPAALPLREIWVWGAGHVGRALVGVIAPLPGVRVTWIDSGAERFPAAIPDGVVPRAAANPARLADLAPTGAEHFVMTYSHALDLEICHRLLSRGFGALGLIGSLTKRARFRSRLQHLGHPDALISRIVCPIGEPALGKHPQAIAVGVAARLLSGASATESARESAG
jgi:xanthine dehydrogenase accessory factor